MSCRETERTSMASLSISRWRVGRMLLGFTSTTEGSWSGNLYRVSQVRLLWLIAIRRQNLVLRKIVFFFFLNLAPNRVKKKKKKGSFLISVCPRILGPTDSKIDCPDPRVFLFSLFPRQRLHQIARRAWWKAACYSQQFSVQLYHYA